MASPFSFNYKELQKEESKTKSSNKTGIATLECSKGPDDLSEEEKKELKSSFFLNEPTQPLSYRIALNSGLFECKGKYLRPKKGSNVAELFGHDKSHNVQAYIKKANLPEKEAFVCGGSDYTLQQFADALGVSLDEPQKEIKQATPPTRLPKKEKTCDRKGGYKQHSRETNISDVEDKYFRYFEEHGIENPKEFLASLGVMFTTKTEGFAKGQKTFLFKLHNDSFKYFILDDSFKVIDKRTNKEGSDTTWRDPKHDNGQDLYIFEGFADCLKALQMGYNAFTWSGGVQSFGKLADCFETKRERKVFLVLDQDEASNKALPKIASAFAEKGHLTYTIPLDFENGPGKDFCDWIKSHTMEDFEGLQRSYHPSKKEILETHEVITLPECKLDELEAELDHLPEKTGMIFKAPTGLGKTTTLVRYMLKHKSERFVFFCSTIEESSHVTKKVEECGGKAFLLSSIEGVGQKTAIEKSRIVISNYGYLGRQGMTCNKHPYAESLLKDRVVICDEVQELYRMMKVFHPLRTRYLQKDENYRQTSSCPKFSRKGDCGICFPGYKRQALNGKGKDRSFFSNADENAFIGYSKPFTLDFDILKQAGFESWEDLENPQKYERAQGTLFFRNLPENLKRSLNELETNSNDEYRSYLNSLLNSLKSPQIRTEFPLLGENPTHPQNIEGKAKFPMKACTIPTITGLDVWPIGQIVKYSKKAIFTSATIPQGFYDSVDNILDRQKWSFKAKEVRTPPFSFDVTLLKTKEKLGYTTLSYIILEHDKTRQEKAFIVLGSKQESISFQKFLREISDKVQRFEGDGYQETISGAKNKSIKYLCTYPRSAITRGVDLPDVNLVIVDCAHFIPQSAIGTLKEGMSKEEKRLELAKDIMESLTQICGRVLRSNEKREPGRTVRDERKIVILLHNLPNELQGFELNQSLVHNQREFTQFVRTRKRGTVESVASAISVSLDGGDPEQVTQETIKEEIKERYKEGGNENISIKDRGLISEEDRRKIKVAKKVEKLKAKIIDGKEKGFSKREVMNNCNLSRFFKDYKEKIEEVSSFLDEVFK